MCKKWRTLFLVILMVNGTLSWKTGTRDSFSALHFHIYSMPGTFYNPSASHQISNFVFFAGRQVLRSLAKNILSPKLFLKGAKIKKNPSESKVSSLYSFLLSNSLRANSRVKILKANEISEQTFSTWKEIEEKTSEIASFQERSEDQASFQNIKDSPSL